MCHSTFIFLVYLKKLCLNRDIFTKNVKDKTNLNI